MAIKWYAVPHTGETGSYYVEGSLTDFKREIFLEHGNCCLVTGMNSEQSAKDWIKKYPRSKHKESSR